MTDQISLIDEMAAELGVREDARRKWRERGRVAHKWRLRLMEHASAQGKQIDTAVFDEYRPGAA